MFTRTVFPSPRLSPNRRAKGAPPLKPECGSTNLSNANQNKNLMVRNYNLMFGCVGVITQIRTIKTGF